jgi:hypothetical protein
MGLKMKATRLPVYLLNADDAMCSCPKRRHPTSRNHDEPENASSNVVAKLASEVYAEKQTKTKTKRQPIFW